MSFPGLRTPFSRKLLSASSYTLGVVSTRTALADFHLCVMLRSIGSTTPNSRTFLRVSRTPWNSCLMMKDHRLRHGFGSMMLTILSDHTCSRLTRQSQRLCLYIMPHYLDFVAWLNISSLFIQKPSISEVAATVQ